MRAFLILLLTLQMLCGCTPREDSIKEISRLVEKQRVSNENGDLDFIMSIYPETLTVVSYGDIYNLGKHDVTERRRKQFKESSFIIKNLTPPVINASNDGTLGWAITKIERTRKDIHTGRIESTETTSALVVFRKQNDKWVIDAVAETYK